MRPTKKLKEKKLKKKIGSNQKVLSKEGTFNFRIDLRVLGPRSRQTT